MKGDLRIGAGQDFEWEPCLRRCFPLLHPVHHGFAGKVDEGQEGWGKGHGMKGRQRSGTYIQTLSPTSSHF